MKQTKLDTNPVLGNIVLALIFGGGLLIFTLFVFAGHPQFWMFMGFSVMGMIVIFIAGTAHHNENGKRTTSNKPTKLRQNSATGSPRQFSTNPSSNESHIHE